MDKIRFQTALAPTAISNLRDVKFMKSAELVEIVNVRTFTLINMNIPQ